MFETTKNWVYGVTCLGIHSSCCPRESLQWNPLPRQKRNSASFHSLATKLSFGEGKQASEFTELAEFFLKFLLQSEPSQHENPQCCAAKGAKSGTNC